MRWGYSSFVLPTVLALACAQGYPTEKERREFRTLEIRLADLDNAAPEDRSFRLEELMSMEVKTDRIKEIQRLCIASYRSFDRSNALLAEARSKTAKTEAAIARAEEAVKAGQALDIGLQTELFELRRDAEAAVKTADQSIDRSEDLARSCKTRCNAFRALFSQ